MNFDRRAVALLGGVGAAALLSKQAEAATPFTTFAYSATGASGSQTDPNRWQQASINVKDWGAVGDGVTNDTTAVQNAINYAAGLSTNSHTAFGSTVYFPPGEYLISNPPLRVTGDSNVGLRGAAPASNINVPGAASVITGNSSTSPIIAVYGDDSQNALGSIINLAIINTSTTGGMALRWDAAAPPAVIENCCIQGYGGAHLGGANPIRASGNNNTKIAIGQIVTDNGTHFFRCTVAGTTGGSVPSFVTTTLGVSTTTDGTVTWLYVSTSGGYNVFGISVTNCNIVSTTSVPPGGSIATGNVGIWCGQVSFFQCRIPTWDYGIVASNFGSHARACHFENCGSAITLGDDDLGATNAITGFSLIGCTGESNLNAIVVVAATSGIIAGSLFVGDAFPTGGGNINVARGLYLFALRDVVISGCYMQSATYSTGAIDCTNLSLSGAGVTFISTESNNGTSGWISIPDAQKALMQCINCNNPSLAMAFANLPSSPVEGMIFNITDGTNGLTWGQTATNTGTHTTHYAVRYNGSNWTVMGQ